MSAQSGAAAHGMWESIATGQPLHYELLESRVTPRLSQPPPLVIYLQHLAAPRVGTESDETIIEDLRKSGHGVMTLDYAAHPRARVPFLNRDLGKLRAELWRTKNIGGLRVDPAHIYIVPSGSRLVRDVVFFPDATRTLAMDIIYPSKPAQPVGAIIEFSCDNENRFGDYSLTYCSDTILEAEATEGFAVAMADHPVAAPYEGIDAMPDCAVRIKAAVRTLRAQSASLGLNGRIVPVGFSRGSGMALMLVTTEGMNEFEGQGAHADVSSAVQGAVVMSGRFTYLDLLPDDHMVPRYSKVWGKRAASPDVWKRHGALDYLTRATPMPLFLTINITEAPDALYQMKVLRKRLAELGSDEIFAMDREPRGHKVTLVPEILEAMNAYFRQRLE